MPPPAIDRRALERFHHQAIALLRSLREVDRRPVAAGGAGLSGPRASALSVLVFGGPRSLGELARAEGVKPPTMSRLVKALEADGLVRTSAEGADQRRIRIEPSAAGRKRLLAARERRIDELARRFADATADERVALARVVELLERTGASTPAGGRTGVRGRPKRARPS